MVTLSYLIGFIKSLFDLVDKNAPVLDNYVEINDHNQELKYLL